METIGADCSRIARATTLGPPPQSHGWVRLGEVGLKYRDAPFLGGGGGGA